MTASAVGALAAGSFAIAAPAANAGSTILKTGTCTGVGHITLQLQHSDPGQIEAGFELSNVRPGSQWAVTLRHDGTTYFHATRTAGADHSLSIDRTTRDLAGSDYYRGVFRNVATGATCSVTGSI